MGLDQFKNFAKVTVSIGYDASATSIVLSSGHGAKLPTAPFNAVWWNSTDYPDPADDPNVEIVRVTNIATDTLTVTRGQESVAATTKNASGRTYKMIAGVTAKSLVTDMASVGFKDAMTLKSADIASAATTDLSTATGELVDITGTVTITALGTLAAGIERVVRFNGILTLTHNATSLILPGAANITTANKDIAIFRSLGSGNWVCVSYTRGAAPPISGTNTGDQVNATAIFGDGSDGALTFASGGGTVAGATRSGSVYTMTRDIYASSVTVNAGMTLKTANFKLFCTGTVTLATGSPGGIIQNDGNSASGTTGGTATAAGTLKATQVGPNGTLNSAGTNSSGPSNPVMATTSGAGGSDTNAGGTGSTISPAATAGSFRNLYQALSIQTAAGTQAGAAPSGGSGGAQAASGGVGGGGGAGGGICPIYAKSIIVNSGATISANGGNGGDASTHGGGGGGGGGGVIILVYNTYTNAGTVQANGGTHGNGAGGGNVGVDGGTGTVITINNNA